MDLTTDNVVGSLSLARTTTYGMHSNGIHKHGRPIAFPLRRPQILGDTGEIFKHPNVSMTLAN